MKAGPHEMTLVIFAFGRRHPDHFEQVYNCSHLSLVPEKPNMHQEFSLFTILNLALLAPVTTVGMEPKRPGCLVRPFSSVPFFLTDPVKQHAILISVSDHWQSGFLSITLSPLLSGVGILTAWASAGVYSCSSCSQK